VGDVVVRARGIKCIHKREASRFIFPSFD
jgi:hypothetical protein